MGSLCEPKLKTDAFTSHEGRVGAASGLSYKLVDLYYLLEPKFMILFVQGSKYLDPIGQT